jgi:hypothetical protein
LGCATTNEKVSTENPVKVKFPCLSERVKPNKSESLTRTAITIELCKGVPVESFTLPVIFMVCAKLPCSEINIKQTKISCAILFISFILYRGASLAISFDDKTLKMSNGMILCLVVYLVDIKTPC